MDAKDLNFEDFFNVVKPIDLRFSDKIKEEVLNRPENKLIYEKNEWRDVFAVEGVYILLKTESERIPQRGVFNTVDYAVPVYVGSSAKVGQRIYQHIRQDSHNFDSFALIRTGFESRDTFHALETFLIGSLECEGNKQQKTPANLFAALQRFLINWKCEEAEKALRMWIGAREEATRFHNEVELKFWGEVADEAENALNNGDNELFFEKAHLLCQIVSGMYHMREGMEGFDFNKFYQNIIGLRH